MNGNHEIRLSQRIYSPAAAATGNGKDDQRPKDRLEAMIKKYFKGDVTDLLT
jgi:hypothetical protein